MTDRIKAQRAEFEAADKFAEQNRRLRMTPIVDDDYPEVRHAYEGALAELLKAMKANGRFEPRNRYGLSCGPIEVPDCLTITISGPAGSGKTRWANLLRSIVETVNGLPEPEIEDNEA